MRKIRIFCIVLAALLSISACGKKPAETSAPTETAAVETTSAETEVQPAEYEIYKEWDGIIFGFTSGVGAWETMVEIKADGSFTGEFYDANMGEIDEDCPNGTIYESKFSGQLSEPVMKDANTYTAEVLDVQYDRSAFEDGKDYYIEDGVKYVASPSYGLNKGDKLTIYGPETLYGETTEEFRFWIYWQFYEKDDDTKLGEYGIYNESADAGFFPDHYAMGDAADLEDNAAADDAENELYKAAKNAYANQEIPEELMLTDLPVAYNYVSKAYESVTIENMQGGWINRYKEGDSEVVEILSVNGERGKIESYRDGVKLYGWDGEGIFSIEDRSDRNVCPAVRINSDEDGSNICTIYVRWVKTDSFYDGGFLNEWQRMDRNEFNYLMDTVTLENLEGVWYSEYADNGGFYRNILTIDGDKATLLETIDGEVSRFWNNSGKAEIVMTDYRPGKTFPELIIKDEVNDAGVAGIYISNVTDDYFFDQGFCRYWYKVPKNISPYWGDNN